MAKDAEHKQALQEAEVDAALREQEEEAAAALEQETQEEQAQPDFYDDDVDAQELKEAQAALENDGADDEAEDQQSDEDAAPAASEASAEQTKPTETPAAAAADEATGETPTGEEPEAASPMIPKARLDEALNRQREAEAAALAARDEANFYKGLAAGRSPVNADGTPAAAPEPTPEERIQALQAQSVENAQKFDDGEFGFAELQKRNNEIESQIFDIRKAQLTPPASAANGAASAAAADDLYLEQRTAQIEAEHPYLGTDESGGDVLDEAGWQFIKLKAVDALTEQGIELPNDANARLTNSQALALRIEIGKQSDIWGPALNPNFKPASTDSATTPKPREGLSDVGKARAKHLEAAAAQPPNTNTAGTPGLKVTHSDADIAAMDDEEVMARLTPEERRRLVPE